MASASRAGVGKSTKRAAFEAGRQAAELAVAALAGAPPHVVLVFATTGYDQAKLIAGVRAVTGETSLCGCSGEGIITRQGADERSHAVAVVVLHSERARFGTLVIPDAAADSFAAAGLLADQIDASFPKAKVVLLFPDGGTVACGPLIEELDRRLPRAHIAGGSAGCIMNTTSRINTYQYHEARVYHHALSALVIEGDVSAEIAVSHGCEPVGLERTITKASGAHIIEIDGRPAFDVFREYLDGNPDDLRPSDILHICVGLSLPRELRANYGEYVIRTPLALDKANNALFFPGGGFSQGTTIQMTRRDGDLIRSSARKMAVGISSRRKQQAPWLVLQFDCAGRGQLLFGDRTSEYAIYPLQNAFADSVPWIGFHTLGELAALQNKTYYHNFTAVLCALYDDTLP